MAPPGTPVFYEGREVGTLVALDIGAGTVQVDWTAGYASLPMDASVRVEILEIRHVRDDRLREVHLVPASFANAIKFRPNGFQRAGTVSAGWDPGDADALRSLGISPDPAPMGKP